MSSSTDFTPLLQDDSSGTEGSASQGDGPTKNKLGTVMGVVVPCLCALWGAILFLRLPWSVGQAGVLGALLTFAVAGLTVFLTVLSIAAVSTSGHMGAGGAYYIISRTLGVEAGGSIGIVFFAANSVGITFYLVALAGEIDSLAGGDGNPWMIKAYASGALLALLIISLIGASFFTKLNAVVLFLMVVAVIAAIVSFLAGVSKTEGYTGPSAETLANNLLFDYGHDDTGKDMDFFSVLIIVFPAMTGVMSGANMSGDLASPGESIGKGTLWAVTIAIAVYAALIVVIGASVERSALQDNLNIMQDVCLWQPLIAVGLIASTVSSALGNLVGSGRILQALARDELFPFMGVFKWGTKKGDEPIPATLMAWAIAQACIFIGSLDAVAAIISGFFLLVYWAVNASCLLMRIAGAPNFRPKFRYFSWHTALAGALACLVVLFLSSAVYASISIVIVFFLFIYVGYTAQNTDWGDVTQALIFHQVRKYLLRLDERRLHPKNWRPSLLVCVQDPSSRAALALVDFANNLKKGGLYVLGHAVVGDLGDVGDRLVPLRYAWLDFIAAARVKAFPEIAVAPTARVAYQNLVMCSGLGGLKPNTVVLCLPGSVLQDARPATVEEGEEEEAGAGSDEEVEEDTGAAVTPAAAALSSNGKGSTAGWRPTHRAKASSSSAAAAEAAHRSELEAEVAEAAACVRAVANGQFPSTLVRVSSGGAAGDGTGRGRGGEVLRRRRPMTGGFLSSSSASASGSGSGSSSSGGGAAAAMGEVESGQVVVSSRASAGGRGVELGRLGSSANAASSSSAASAAGSEMAASVMDATAAKDAEEFMDVVRDCLFLGRNVLLTRWFGELDKKLIVSFARTAKKAKVMSEASRLRIDVWTSSRQSADPEGALLLAMQLADVLHRTDVWASCTALRVCSIVEHADEEATETERLGRFLAEYNYEADIRVVSMLSRRSRPVVSELHARNLAVPPASRVDIMGDAACINEVIRHHCENTCVLFTPVPTPLPAAADAEMPASSSASDPRLATDAAYLHYLDLLTQGLPPTVLVGSSGSVRFVTKDM